MGVIILSYRGVLKLNWVNLCKVLNNNEGLLSFLPLADFKRWSNRYSHTHLADEEARDFPRHLRGQPHSEPRDPLRSTQGTTQAPDSGSTTTCYRVILSGLIVVQGYYYWKFPESFAWDWEFQPSRRSTNFRQTIDVTFSYHLLFGFLLQWCFLKFLSLLFFPFFFFLLIRNFLRSLQKSLFL